MITVFMRPFNRQRFANQWSKRERCENWLSSLTEKQKELLGQMFKDNLHEVARDYIEDNGGIRSFARFLVWVDTDTVTGQVKIAASKSVL